MNKIHIENSSNNRICCRLLHLHLNNFNLQYCCTVYFVLCAAAAAAVHHYMCKAHRYWKINNTIWNRSKHQELNAKWTEWVKEREEKVVCCCCFIIVSFLPFFFKYHLMGCNWSRQHAALQFSHTSTVAEQTIRKRAENRAQNKHLRDKSPTISSSCEHKFRNWCVYTINGELWSLSTTNIKRQQPRDPQIVQYNVHFRILNNGAVNIWISGIISIWILVSKVVIVVFRTAFGAMS